MRSANWWIGISLLVASSVGYGFPRAALPALPEGNTGIASRFPADAGIDADPSVLFHDGFESVSSASELQQKWNGGVYQMSQLRIATESANIHGGQKALEMTVPQQSAELSNSVARMLSQEQDVLFMRYYSRFDPGWDQVGSSHNGGCLSAHYFINGQATPGVPANGTNKYLATFEDGRFESAVPTPGPLNIYIYWPEQADNYGDHFFPSGTVLPFSSTRSGAATFGPDFVSRPDVTPDLGRWYCYEFMVKANTPGLRDGRIACWVDGRLIADFPNLRLRDVSTLKMDRAELMLHIHSNTTRVNKKWYDDVVVAKSYIGPMSTGSGTPPPPGGGTTTTPPPPPAGTGTTVAAGGDGGGSDSSRCGCGTAGRLDARACGWLALAACALAILFRRRL
jgi:hypothetical protein